MIKVAMLDDYQHLARKLAGWNDFSEASLTIFDEHLSVEEAKAELRPFDAVCLMRERMAFPEELIAALPNLRLIAITGRKHRTLDLSAARRRGIVTSYTTASGDGSWSTAELAWGLALDCARNISQSFVDVREGRWQSNLGVGLRGKTLGVVGLGRIGKQLATFGQAFGMKVVAWSPNMKPEAAREVGVEPVGKAELFGSSDLISLHLVLGATTRGIVGQADLAAMKPGAILINTARAELVEQASLLAAVEAGKIRLGVDVYPREPLPLNSAYRELGNCVATPHLGYVTEETMRAFHEGTLEVVKAFIAGSPIRVIEQAS